MKRNNNYSERRQCKRFRIKYPAILISNDNRISASTFNISEGGIGIELFRKLNKSNSLKYKIQIDSVDFKQDIDTNVVWCKHIGDGKYRAGLKMISE